MRTAPWALPLWILFLVPAAWGQARAPYRVELSFERYWRYDEILEAMERIARAYPELVRLETIGRSLEGRPLVVAIVTDPETGDDRSKAAMWIDGNVHGNEIQGGEVVLYTLWRLCGEHGRNPEITRLLRERAFYLLPSQNPDGREAWFREPNSASSSRSNRRPFDDDRDGVADEDPPDDLDGDGSIVTMYVEDAAGEWIRDPLDPASLRRLQPDEEPGPVQRFRRIGREGIDNDGDGRINEDPIGGDDMNRDWPADWMPRSVQYGAAPYPLHAPETRAIARFLLDHPNVAAVQSYHNAGGMILRGPGSPERKSAYPPEDERVYRALAEQGEKLLPHYRSLVIHADLYTVHGGFVTWAYEGLGVFAFSNELTTSREWFGDGGRSDARGRRLFREKLRFGEGFVPLHRAEHPDFGEVWLGGPDRWGGRTQPPFLLLEECHRNFGFTMLHADQMPRVQPARRRVKRLGERLFRAVVEWRNDRLLPTRSARARALRIGRPDVVSVSVEPGRVVASGRLDAFSDEAPPAPSREPGRVVVESGLPGRTRAVFSFLVEAPPGARLRATYASEKGGEASVEIELRGE